MEATLTVVGGKASKAHVVLRLPTVIGRSREAGLTIAHPMVSRRHCELFEANGALHLRDLGSLNGTFVGTQPVTEAVLRLHDVFTVGPLTFRVDSVCAAKVEPPVPVPHWPAAPPPAPPGAPPLAMHAAPPPMLQPVETPPAWIPEPLPPGAFLQTPPGAGTERQLEPPTEPPPLFTEEPVLDLSQWPESVPSSESEARRR
jgi:predicted component of type VI protein secretion system